jgi:hypothetical protein
MNLEALNENKHMIGVQRIEQLIVFSVCDIEDELRQALEVVKGSPPLSATHSQYNQMN